jgi:hypothetical protein
MAQFGAPARSRGLGLISIVFGLLGLALCWWTPTGMVLSLAGLVIGLVGCATARRGGWAPSAAGMILSAAALAVCWIIAVYGMEFIRFSALH